MREKAVTHTQDNRVNLLTEVSSVDHFSNSFTTLLQSILFVSRKYLNHHPFISLYFERMIAQLGRSFNLEYHKLKEAAMAATHLAKKTTIVSLLFIPFYLLARPF